MIHETIGIIGHELVILSFVAALVSAFAYWKDSRVGGEDPSWKKLGRGSFYVHSLAVIGVIITLFTIIYNHYYEYHYAWSHSSNNLPTHFMISCFWEGQEGSFLLWIFWHMVIGMFLLHRAKEWEGSVMAIFALVQAFLVSMILGVVPIDVADFALKIGSDPFILLRDALDDPFLQANPNFVPEDGTGLNPLLQNYWMVIHPPTLFLGFALTLVPFAFCMAGLQHKKYTEWIKPALPWTSFGGLVLGIGIMMGAYWAYETLNFGGYWSWDPVENAVYIPWLTLVASMHLMIVYQRKKVALKSSMIMVVSTFILILYATFLTRSGILGDSSVHSFTDLGLSGQLLLYLLAFLSIAVIGMAIRWKHIPSTGQEATAYDGEFWLFIGVMILVLSAFQVLIPTSMPVFNSIAGLFGIESNLAPPAEPEIFYTKWQLWFGVGIAIASATAQFFWWRRIKTGKELISQISLPIVATMVLTIVVMKIWEMQDPTYIILLLASTYSLVSNGMVLFQFGKKKFTLSGGAITHIGIALMLLGVLFSAGYNKVISLNTSGLLYNREFTEEMNQKNWLLFRSQPQRVRERGIEGKFVSPKIDGLIDEDLLLRTGVPGKMIAKTDIAENVKQGDTLQVSRPYYEVTYKGPRMTSDEVPGYIDKELLLPSENVYEMIAKEDLIHEGKTYKKAGDTLQVYNENIYYEVEYKTAVGQRYTLYPRIQDNPRMGMVPSPDINTFADKDIYIHVTNIPDPEQPTEWSEAQEYTLSVGDTFIVNDYIAIFDGISPVNRVAGIELATGDVAVKANVRILGNNEQYDIQPMYVIKNRTPGTIPDELRQLGLRMGFVKVEPSTDKFTLSASTTQKDWIIVNALEKPLINLLWIGTILMGVGFGISAYRRYQGV